MALMATDGVECSTCERLHFRPEGLLTIDMNAGGRICPTVTRMLIDDLEAGKPVRILRTRLIDDSTSYVELMPPHAAPKRSKKQRIEEELKQSDLTAQLSGRDDVEYGHHDSLPRGEHVTRLGKK